MVAATQLQWQRCEGEDGEGDCESLFALVELCSPIELVYWVREGHLE